MKSTLTAGYSFLKTMRGKKELERKRKARLLEYKQEVFGSIHKISHHLYVHIDFTLYNMTS